MNETPDELRARADRIESATCTGLGASWCPVHGDCTCANRGESMSDHGCPLHDELTSSHAAATTWTCESCGTVWPDRPVVDEIVGCPECGTCLPEALES